MTRIFRKGEAVVAPAGQRKTRKVRAKLPKLQPRDLTWVAAQQRPKRCPALRWPVVVHDHLQGAAIMRRRLHTQPTRPASRPEGKGRTEHLTAPLLLSRVTAGSPKLVSLTPVGRRSRHSSQTAGVTPGTAAAMRTGTSISRRATGGESSSARVKGGSACESNPRKQWAC